MLKIYRQFIMNKRNMPYFVPSNFFYSSVALAVQHMGFCACYCLQRSYVQLIAIRFKAFETELVQGEMYLGCLAINFSKVAAQIFKVTLQSALTARHRLAPTSSKASTTNDRHVSLLYDVKNFFSHYTFSHLYTLARQDTFVKLITSVGIYLCMYVQHSFHSRVVFKFCYFSDRVFT